MDKIRNFFRRKKVKPKNPPRRVFAFPNAPTVHSSVLDLAYSSHQDPTVFQQPLSQQLQPRTLSILSDLPSECDYERLQRNPTTSQDCDSSADQTHPKTVFSRPSDTFDFRSDPESFDCSSSTPPPVPRPRLTGPDRGQLPDLPHDSGFRIADLASSAPDIPATRYSQVIRADQNHSEEEPEVNQSPCDLRSVPGSAPVRRVPRNHPIPPVPQGSSDRNQEASPIHTLVSDRPESPAVADALPEAYRVAEFIDGRIGRLPVQPGLISVTNAAGPVTIHHNGPVTIHHTIIISPEGESLANILAREQYKVSSSIINRPTAAQGQQYFPENYVVGAPEARKEAMNRGRSRNEAS